jgi:hypothetical protein
MKYANGRCILYFDDFPITTTFSSSFSHMFLNSHTSSDPEVDRIWKFQRTLTKVKLFLKIPYSIYFRMIVCIYIYYYGSNLIIVGVMTKRTFQLTIFAILQKLDISNPASVFCASLRKSSISVTGSVNKILALYGEPQGASFFSKHGRDMIKHDIWGILFANTTIIYIYITFYSVYIYIL